MPDKINRQQFIALMERLADAWGEQDTETAIDCFTPDAVYMQPPDVQFYTGHEQFRALLVRFDRKVAHFMGAHFIVYSLINFRHLLAEEKSQ
jgi:ketosteroid isomerase-like protein